MLWPILVFALSIGKVASQQTVWGQCGGVGWTGSTACSSGTSCVVVNSYYYQCQPASSTTAATTAKSSATASATPSSTTTPSTSSTPQSIQPSSTSKPPSSTLTTSTSSKPATTPSTTPSPTNISACLAASGVPYDTQGSADWNTDILPFNQRLSFTPAAIAVPTTVPQVQGAVSCGVQLGYKINAKGGGHGYASHGLGGENGHLVIELDRMYNVTLNTTTNVAVVQAGARLGHVLTQLDAQGKRAFSTGTCPGVGVSGHALHGGYGFSSRKYGLALDWIAGAQMVLPNSTLIHVSPTEHPDIFWAIRGAGSNFGVVVSYEFNTFAQPSQVTYFTVTTNWNVNNMQANLLQLENYTRYNMPAELTMRYTINPGGSNEFEGMYYGDKTGLQTALAPLFNNTSPKLSLGYSTTTTFMGAFKYYAYTPATDPSYPYNAQENFYAKSLAVNHLNGSAAQAFVNYVFTQGPSNSRNWWLQLDLHGGANSAVTNGDFSTSSYAHRDKLFLMQFYDRIYSGAYPSNGFSFLNGWVSSVTNNLNASDWGMYINYADSTLDRATAQNVYYGANLPRLQALKAVLDPNEVFYYPTGSLQAIAS